MQQPAITAHIPCATPLSSSVSSSTNTTLPSPRLREPPLAVSAVLPPSSQQPRLPVSALRSWLKLELLVRVPSLPLPPLEVELALLLVLVQDPRPQALALVPRVLPLSCPSSLSRLALTLLASPPLLPSSLALLPFFCKRSKAMLFRISGL